MLLIVQSSANKRDLKSDENKNKKNTIACAPRENAFKTPYLVIKAIGTNVDDVADKDFLVIMEKYKSELADTYVAYTALTHLRPIND